MSVARRLRRHLRAHSDTWVLKRVLLSLLVVGGLSCFTLASTFALFTTEVTNANGSIASGTLYLGNQPSTSGSMCFSYNGTANSNASCSALTGSAVMYPAGATATANITVTNGGTIAGSTLALYMPSCSAASTTGAPSPGGGNPCTTGGLEVEIMETGSNFSTANCGTSMNTACNCRYPETTGTCAFFANTLNTLATTKNSATSMYGLGEGLAASQTRYFVIAMALPSTAANNLQGEAAQFNLTWNLSQ